MHYSYEIDVSPSDTIDDPIIFHVKLASGIVRKMLTIFEEGDMFSTCVTLWDGAVQLVPSNVDGFLCGNNISIESTLHYDLTKSGNNLYLVIWNRGGVYSHTVNIYLDVKSDDEPDITSLQSLMIDTINRLIDLCRSLI